MTFMEHRRLGRTELELVVIGVGTWQFLGNWSRDHTERGVDNILGIQLIDTAQYHGDRISGIRP
jgi:aryl-alcohol dehydrogenase-like predicted oxidoreductase